LLDRRRAPFPFTSFWVLIVRYRSIDAGANLPEIRKTARNDHTSSDRFAAALDFVSGLPRKSPPFEKLAS
jgi:hypothetical protein